MGRYKEALWGFECPYRDACPHLDGLSTTWTQILIADAQRDDYRNGHLALHAERELKTLEAEQNDSELKMNDSRPRIRRSTSGSSNPTGLRTAPQLRMVCRTRRPTGEDRPADIRRGIAEFRIMLTRS